MTNGSTLRINRATEDDIPFILKSYKEIVTQAGAPAELTAERIKSDVLGKDHKAFINVMFSDDIRIGFIHYIIAGDKSDDQNVYVQTLYIDSLAPNIGVSSVGRTVLNHLFVLHRAINIQGVFANTEYASHAMQSITSQHDVDFRYNVYSPQSQRRSDMPTQVLKVRSATPADIPFIIKGNQIIDEKSNEIPPNPLNEKRLMRDVFNPANPRAYILIAEVDKQPAGFIIYSFCYFSSKGEGIWLSNFYIDPFCRKAGIGKAMADHMKFLHPGASSVFGAVACVNNVARHFFRSLGGKPYTDYFMYGTENDWGVVP